MWKHFWKELLLTGSILVMLRNVLHGKDSAKRFAKPYECITWKIFITLSYKQEDILRTNEWKFMDTLSKPFAFVSTLICHQKKLENGLSTDSSETTKFLC